MDKITKLSQAIRLGATIRGQCFGSFFKNEQSCALGAAMEAIFPGVPVPSWKKGPFPGKPYYEKLKDRFPFLNTRVTKLPEGIGWETGCCQPPDYSVVILRLNDTYCWSREEIAGWLEKQGY
jgi:hypothetical protein